MEDYNGIIQTLETFVSEEGADLVVRSICDMLTKEANRKLRCDISESKKSVQKIEKEARRAVEVLSNKETVAVQIEENFKKIRMSFYGDILCDFTLKLKKSLFLKEWTSKEILCEVE